MSIETVSDLRNRLAGATDNDQLVAGVFDEIEQDWVRTGAFWIRLDRRVPWQLAQCFRQHSYLLSGLRLRLDLSQIESAKQHLSPLRKAYWWGAPFRWDKVHAGRGPIETVHADPMDPLQRLNRVAQARFRWNFPRDENIAVLQIEEFRDAVGTPNGDLSTRYLHSILDLHDRTFKHLDGAVKSYTAETYAVAYDNAEVKAPVYQKVFRTDEHLKLDDTAWMAIVASYFANDELIREYFDGAY